MTLSDTGQNRGAASAGGRAMPGCSTRRRATASRPSPAGIDLEIAAGETVALVGETGAGKSTMVKLLARFYDPDQGSVSVDGARPPALDLGAYRRQLGYVPQEPFLFSGTIRDNIAYGRPEASDAEVEAAARAVGAHEFIAELPGGYHHAAVRAGPVALVRPAPAASPWPGPSWSTRPSSSWTRPPPTSTWPPRPGSPPPCGGWPGPDHGGHRPPTADCANGRPHRGPATRGQVVEDGSHDELLALGGRYAAMWEAFELVSQASVA